MSMVLGSPLTSWNGGFYVSQLNLIENSKWTTSSRLLLLGKISLFPSLRMMFIGMVSTIQVSCIRTTVSWTMWQLSTYDTVQASYFELMMDYDRGIVHLTLKLTSLLATGNIPFEKTSIDINECKKACIEFVLG